MMAKKKTTPRRRRRIPSHRLLQSTHFLLFPPLHWAGLKRGIALRLEADSFFERNDLFPFPFRTELWAVDLPGCNGDVFLFLFLLPLFARGCETTKQETGVPFFFLHLNGAFRSSPRAFNVAFLFFLFLSFAVYGKRVPIRMYIDGFPPASCATQFFFFFFLFFLMEKICFFSVVRLHVLGWIGCIFRCVYYVSPIFFFFSSLSPL